MKNAADVVDALLEATVVGSFTRIGSAARSRLEDWSAEPVSNLAGQVIVLTGATSGIGLATARRLASQGAHVVIVARDRKRATAACERLRIETGAIVDFVEADVGDLSAVRRAAGEILHAYPKVYALVHNAGALDATRGTSPQGIERTVASQVVGPFLLTELLLPALRAASPSRVIWVSSGGMYTEPLNVADVEMRASDYDGVTAYARAKRAQVTLSEMMADRFRSDGIVVHAMHPGWADTPGVSRSLPTFRRIVGPLLRTADEAADTLAWLVSSEGLPRTTTGRFWLDHRARPIHRLARTRRSDTPEERERLWSWVSEKSRAPLP